MTPFTSYPFKAGWLDSEVHEAEFDYLGANRPSQPDPGNLSYDGNFNLWQYNGATYTYNAQKQLTSASNTSSSA